MGIVSALVLISIIVSQFGAVHAQDYVTAYEGSMFEEGSDSTGYGRILWRLRLSDTSVSPGQSILIFVDITVIIDYQYPVELGPVYVKEGETTTILVYTGLLDQPVTMSCNEFVVAGLSYGEAIPNHFKGSGTTSTELLIPEHTVEGRYHFQAESEGWNPSNIIGLDVNQAGGTSTDQTTGVVIPNPFGTVWWTTFGTEMAWGLGVMAVTSYVLGPAVAAAMGPVDDLATQFLSRWVKPYLRQEAEKLLQPPQPRKAWESGPSCMVCGRPTRFGVGICFACQTQRRFGR